MSVFLILLAAGDSKRLKSNTPKPYQIINNRSLIDGKRCKEVDHTGNHGRGSATNLNFCATSGPNR